MSSQASIKGKCSCIYYLVSRAHFLYSVSSYIINWVAVSYIEEAMYILSRINKSTVPSPYALKIIVYFHNNILTSIFKQPGTH